MDAGLFKKYYFESLHPHVPRELLRDIQMGTSVFEIDEKLYFHIKFLYRAHLFYNSELRFGLERPGLGVVEFFIQDDRYFVRPPHLIEN